MHSAARSASHVFRPLCWALGVLVLGLVAPSLCAEESAEATSGSEAKTIFAKKCATCHGAQGQGAKDGFEQSLGSKRRSLRDLQRLIAETMPQEAPEQCTGEEARQLAEYIQAEFYQNGGPSSRLSRLTVDQYRNAVADLIGHFAEADQGETANSDSRRTGYSAMVGAERLIVPGLSGEYYQSRGMNKADAIGYFRSDSHLDFDFGDGSPAPSISPDQFSIIWKGSLLANEMGYYEFRIRTQNGARMYLNRDPDDVLNRLRDDSSAAGQQAFIDAWVGSGKMRKRDNRIFLLGGRRYPIRVEFFKYLEPTASIKVEWKPPQATWRVLDFNDTSTAPAQRVYVCDTPFPADDRSLGFERGVSASAQWQTAVTESAVAAAEEIVSRLPLLAGFPVPSDLESARDQSNAEPEFDDEQRLQYVQDFIERFASLAYRRPLTEAETQALNDLLSGDPAEIEANLRRAVVMTMLSPHFLYVDLTPAGKAPSSQAIASRLSFALWDSLPDQKLLQAAEADQLQTQKQIDYQARRMVKDPRTRAKLHRFFRRWLEFDERDLTKDRELFPDFDEDVVADLRRSLEQFVDDVVWSRDSDYRQLLQADYLLLNDRLRALYAKEAQPDRDSEDSQGQAIKRKARAIRFGSEFQPLSFPARQRSGVLTHPYLLSAQAYHNTTSPIHRGVFLTRNIVGRALSPPPDAVAFKDEEFASDLTMREKITELTRDQACNGCHSVINPLGFALENFDAVGRWRTMDNQKPVDTTSQYEAASGELLQVSRARDIADFAIENEGAHRAFVIQVFQYVVKQNPLDFPPEMLDDLATEFKNDRFNLLRLWARVASAAALHQDSPSESDIHNKVKT